MKKYTLCKLVMAMLVAYSFTGLQAHADAAGSFKKLQGCRQKAVDAMYGPLSKDKSNKSNHEKWKESQTNTGGGPGRPGDPRNPEDVPWKSQGLRAYYQGLFGSFWNASAFGHGRGFGDRDATPE